MAPFVRLRPIWGAVLLLVAGCAAVPPVPTEVVQPGASTPAECSAFFDALDRSVSVNGVADSLAAPVDGFPYLRVSRFLASFADGDLSEAQFEAWVDRLQRLDTEAREAELHNLVEEPARAQDLHRTVAHCASVLRRRDLADPLRRRELQEYARVPDEYQTWKRFVGLYWVSVWLVKPGIERWHAETLAAYRDPPRPPSDGVRIVSYTPPAGESSPDADEVREILARSAANPLHIPEPAGRDRDRLFAAFAPTWSVEHSGDDDRVGTPAWPTTAERPGVDTGRPTVYRYLSHTRFEGEVLLQLNYSVWFPARPRISQWDILGGHLDGVTWRVTLAPDGSPLLYDTIHNCGCYHLFFPTRRLRVQAPDRIYQEPAFAPRAAPELEPGRGAAVRIAHTTHFVEGITTAPVGESDRVPYAFADYTSLRSLPLPGGGRRSLFRPDGIVPGTERGERWLLWPMGVPGPGEMREWGHHATAFVGRRHFDDSDLLEVSFERAN